MSVLVTGGLGYIGSHVVRVLELAGVEVIVVDDFSCGSSRQPASDVVRLDLASAEAAERLAELMVDRDVTAVIHLAGRKQVEESVSRPLWYYRQNVDSVLSVLEAMVAAHVSQLIFSSSAAVYGAVAEPRVLEGHTLLPINPYGSSKLMGERVIEDAATSHGLRTVALRYFNVGGAGWPELGDTGTSNLIPLVFGQVRAGEPAVVFGDDYDTRDGTCVRDYVHVLDLADAHVRALQYLLDGGASRSINLGTGTGTTVNELLRTIATASGRPFPIVERERRPGDSPVLVANNEMAREVLGWTPRYSLEDITRSAWQWHTSSNLLG